ncbi:unnamed protein product [Lathyrus oleraceus]
MIHRNSTASRNQTEEEEEDKKIEIEGREFILIRIEASIREGLQFEVVFFIFPSSISRLMKNNRACPDIAVVFS